MITNCLLHRIARLKKRGGFTLVELLVVIAIIAILAGVALGPITNGIKQAKHNAAVQQARTVGQVLFNYATDNTANGNAYPSGTSAYAIANVLISAGYATDASIFYINGQASPATVGTSSVLTANNVSWCFTTLTGGTGITTCGDSVPIVFFNNGPGATPVTFTTLTAGNAISGTVGTAAPQQTDGMAVFYKANNALYIKQVSGSCANVVPASSNDTGTYAIQD